nr:isoform 2 of nipped-b-like protein b [Quercus suber]
MSSYHRPLSPGGRRIHNPARVSDSVATPASYYNTPSSTSIYANPRASTGVIPISTQTFVNVPPPSSSTRTVELRDSRPNERFDSYTGRPRRSSLLDGQRASASIPTSAASSRSRPTVIQYDGARPQSPLKQTRDKDYYITPAASSKPKVEHKKLYSVDDGNVKLVADVDVTSSNDVRERHHRRRNSLERSGYKTTNGDARDRDGRRPYHMNGSSHARNKNIDDDDAYSYTDAAGMYRDTEPRWRSRKGSLDRNGSNVNSRERPLSMAAESVYEPRTSSKDIGPPPSTRGWDKLNDGLGRARSVRDPSTQRNVAQSPTRARYGDAGSYSDPKDPYYIPARTSSRERRSNSNAVRHERGPDNRHDQYDQYDERREPRRERRSSVTRAGDRSVERRGFGIRPSSRDPYGRSSNESFEKQYMDAGYVEPHRRDTAPTTYHEENRVDQDRKDRLLAERLQNEQWDREGREKDPRWKEDDRSYHRDRDHERERDRARDREREHYTDRDRERERMMEREPERERERHHHRRDTDRDRDRDRDREYNRKENGDKDQSSGLAKAATGSLAGAAAAFGLGKFINKDKDKKDDRDRDRDSDREKERNRTRDEKRDRERDAERDRPRDRDDGGAERRRSDVKDPDRDYDRDLDRERERERDLDRDRPRDRDASRRNDARDNDRDRKQQASDTYSDEGAPYDREPKRDQYRDNDRGLGFAFEGPPDPPRSIPPTDREPARASDRDRDRNAEWERTQEREHEDKPGASAEVAKSDIDPAEDYRRRMEQVQRELSLGRAPESVEPHEEPDPDRQRRQREREQRLRERVERNRDGEAPPAFGILPGVGNININEMPPPPAPQRSLDDESEVSRGTDMHRKPSILDMPMHAESAQIIDNSMSERKENRVRIVDPPTDEEERKPKGILKKPTEKFPEHQNNATKKGIPPGARWTKIDRRLVNPESLNEAKERFEERLDCVIVLRVLTKEEIQRLADRTTELRALQNMRASEDDRAERKNAKRRERRQRDEYSDIDSEDEYAPRTPKMLEAPSTASGSNWSETASSAGSSSWAPSSAPPQQVDFSREHRERSRREPEHAAFKKEKLVQEWYDERRQIYLSQVSHRIFEVTISNRTMANTALRPASRVDAVPPETCDTGDQMSSPDSY